MNDFEIEKKISLITEQSDGKILVRITELDNLPVVIDFLEDDDKYSVSFVSEKYSDQQVMEKVDVIIDQLLEMILNNEIN